VHSLGRNNSGINETWRYYTSAMPRQGRTPSNIFFTKDRIRPIFRCGGGEVTLPNSSSIPSEGTTRLLTPSILSPPPLGVLNKSVEDLSERLKSPPRVIVDGLRCKLSFFVIFVSRDGNVADPSDVGEMPHGDSHTARRFRSGTLGVPAMNLSSNNQKKESKHLAYDITHRWYMPP
jgi:hypothetical protein